jgi:hypothetical protein
LPAVEHVRLRRIRDGADARMPERLSLFGVVRDEVTAAVSAEQ